MFNEPHFPVKSCGLRSRSYVRSLLEMVSATSASQPCPICQSDSCNTKDWCVMTSIHLIRLSAVFATDYITHLDCFVGLVHAELVILIF